MATFVERERRFVFILNSFKVLRDLSFQFFIKQPRNKETKGQS